MHAVYYKNRLMTPAMSKKEAIEARIRLSSLFKDLIVKRVRP